jgi:hypothetical protein
MYSEKPSNTYKHPSMFHSQKRDSEISEWNFFIARFLTNADVWKHFEGRFALEGDQLWGSSARVGNNVTFKHNFIE